MDCITVEVLRRPNESWGMQITGEQPSYIESVQDDSPAHDAGLCSGDYIIAVNGVSVYETNHKEVIALIAECRKIVRLKIFPNDSPLNQMKEELKSTTKQPTEKKKETFWTEDVDVGKKPLKPKLKKTKEKSAKKTEPKELSLISKKHSKNSHIDYEAFCKKDETRLNKHKSKSKRLVEYDMSVNYLNNDGDEDQIIEQKNFIVTRESQKDFDEHYELQGNFAGKKASVAGAFTGDHNVIVAGDDENTEVRGVKSRVLAGIQHFSFTDKQEPSPEDKLKIILYTTTLGIHRTIASNCEQARKILAGYRVKFEDRDIFCYPEYKEELYNRLLLLDGGDFPDMPRLYIEGVYMGGLDELREMSDCGDLRIRLQEFPKYNIRAHCTSCSGTGIVTCSYCNGKTFKKKNRFTNLKCGSCQQRGEVPCTDCI